MLALLLKIASSSGQTVRIDSIKALIPLSRGEILAKTYLDLSHEYMYISPAKVIEYAEQAFAIIIDKKNEELECYANLLMGAGHLLSGDFEEAENYTEIGLGIARRIDNKDYVCEGLISLGAYQMSVGGYPQAVDLFEEAIGIAQTAGLDARVATAKLNLGSIQTNTGDRTEGLKSLMESLKYFENTGNAKIIARIYNNIAVNYHAWEDYEEALGYYNKTLESYSTTNDFIGLVTVYNNIGEIYKDKQEYAKALGYYEETINIADSIDAGDLYKAYGWVGLAETYMYLHDVDRARENATLALGVFEKIDMQEGIANAKFILASIRFDEGEPEQALLLCNEFLEISKNIGLIDLEQKGYELRSRIFSQQGKYKEALESVNQFIQVSRTLLSNRRNEELAHLRSEFDLSVKEREIELLQKNNQIKDLEIKRKTTQAHFLYLTIVLLVLVFVVMANYVNSRRKASDLVQQKNNQIKDQHKELIKVNETKDKFLSIIGHDLRNPIGAFKDVVGQLADFPEMFSDELRQQIISELRDEAEGTYFLLDNLLSWARSQQNNIHYKLEKQDVKILVKNNMLLNSRFSESKHIKLKSEVEDHLFIHADHHMVNLILRNLISNAIKFTNENGEVVISAKMAGENVEISVADTGIGIPSDVLPKLFQNTSHISTYGTNQEKGSGLGLLLCKEFAEINGGNIWVESKLGEGATFTVSFKKYSSSI